MGTARTDFELHVHEYDFLSLVERSSPAAGRFRMLLRPGKRAEMGHLAGEQVVTPV